MAAAEVQGKDIMGLQTWAPVIRDPSINFEKILHGPEKLQLNGPT
jgi:hypothetical protein